MAQTTPKNSGYTIINGSTNGSNGSKVNTWIEYKVTQNITNNTSTIDMYLYARANSNISTSWDGTRSYGSITFNGTQHAGASISGYDFRSTSIYNEFAHYTETVTHDANGQKTVTISGQWDKGASSSTYITGGTVPSTSVTLPTIPRYATVTQSLSSKTETTVAIKWQADATIDYVAYSKDNGATWTGVGSVNATNGTYTITGLSANTNYKIKTKVRRKDSGLQTESSTLEVQTYRYPYCTNMPAFTIGDKVTFKFYNPLSRSITFYINCNGTEIGTSFTTNTTSYTGVNSATVQSQLYATMPNAKSANYSVRVTYGTSSKTSIGGNKISVNPNVCKPVVTGLTYLDTNSTTTAITNNNQQIIRQKSIVRYTASGIQAKNSATISSVKLAVNGKTYTLAQSGSSATGGNATIDSGTNVSATVTVTDSRGYTATKSVTVIMLNWVLPTAIITLQRENNYYSTTTIKANASYSSLSGNNSVTLTYKYKKKGASSWQATGTLTNNVPTTFEADNQYEWDVQVVVTDRLGSTTYNLTLSRGMPIIFFDRLRSSVGINCFPSQDNVLEMAEYPYKNKLPLLANGMYNSESSTGDANNMTETGTYFVATKYVSNLPLGTGNFGYLTVMKAYATLIQQTFQTYNNGRVFVRTYTNGNWQPWYELSRVFNYDQSETYNGLSIVARRRGNTCTVYVTGSPTSEMATANGYVDLCTLNSQFIGYAYTNFILANSNLSIQLNVSKQGVLRLGYALRLTTGSRINIPTTESIYCRITYEM